MAIQAFHERYLGPSAFDEGSRVKTLYSNPSSLISYVPNRLLHLTEQVHCSMAVERLMTKPPVTQGLLKELANDVDNHVEQRIQLFLIQLTIAYRTGLVFVFHSRADLQIGKAVQADYSVAPRLQENGDYEAAHSSTLTSLRVRKGDQIIAFGHGSFFHHLWNTTVCLPTEINQIDKDLDTETSSLGERLSFREISTGFLNECAANKIDPRQSLEYFVNSGLHYIKRLQLTKTSILQQQILLRYQKVFESYQKSLGAGDSIVRTLLFLGKAEKEAKLFADNFYKLVQTEMHRLFSIDMEKLRPAEVIRRPVDPLRTPSRFRQSIVSGIEILNLKITDTPVQYAIFCLKQDIVRNLVVEYLTTVDEAGLKEDFGILRGGGLPSRWISLSEAIRMALEKNRNLKRPHNLNTIMLLMLKQVSEDPIGESVAHLKAKMLVAPKPKSKRVLRFNAPQQGSPFDLSPEGIVKILKEINLDNSSGTTKKYVKLCMDNEELCLISSVYLKSFSSVEALEKELNQLLSIKTSKTVGKLNLGEGASKVYHKALEMIRTGVQAEADAKGKNKKALEEPRGIGNILIHVFKNVSARAGFSS